MVIFLQMFHINLFAFLKCAIGLTSQKHIIISSISSGYTPALALSWIQRKEFTFFF
jgi:hypothetical protein